MTSPYLSTDTLAEKLAKMNQRYIRKPECKEIINEAIETINHLTHHAEKNKRPFSDRFAQEVISEQVKTIDRLTEKLHYLEGNKEEQG